MKYELTLVNEKVSLYNRISWIIIFIHFLIYVYLIFSALKYYRIIGIISLVLLLTLLICKHYLGKKGKFNSFRPFFYLFVLGWISLNLYWVAFIPAVFSLLSGVATTKKVVKLSDRGVLFPSFPQKLFHWNDLGNVILKDGLLTIDAKNNRIIQQLIDEQSSSVDEKSFNEFCKTKLMEHKGYEERQRIP